MLKLSLFVSFLLGGVLLLFLLITPESETSNDFTAASQVPSDVTDTFEQNADFDNKPALLIGSDNAPLTMVEYGDFKCPACNQFHHTAGAQIRREYVDEGLINIEYRNYPFLGPDSGRAARGSYCAYDQGVFTQYHDKVYGYIWDNHYTQGDQGAQFQDILTTDKLLEIMENDIDSPLLFEECVESTDYNRFIDADLLLGADDGITGTPGFVIVDQKIVGPSNFNSFKTVLDNELRKL